MSSGGMYTAGLTVSKLEMSAEDYKAAVVLGQRNLHGRMMHSMLGL